jgi:hypothetical protein
MLRNSWGNEMTQTDAPRSRRAVLATAVGAAAATAAAAVSRPFTVTAATGDPFILGQGNTASEPTELQGRLYLSNIGEETTGSFGSTTGKGIAVLGTSAEGTGVSGISEGISGASNAGVRGVAHSRQAIGVLAIGTAEGVALRVDGRATLATRSGRATIEAGRSYVDIDLRSKGGLAGTPLCFATLRSYRPGVYVAAVRANYPSSHKARIYLNKAVSSTTNVSWFVLN